MRRQVLKIRVGDLRELIGERHLLGQAEHDQQNAAQDFFAEPEDASA